MCKKKEEKHKMCANLKYVHCEYIYQKRFIVWSRDRKWNENLRHKLNRCQKSLSLIKADELLKWENCWDETKKESSTHVVQLSKEFIVDWYKRNLEMKKLRLKSKDELKYFVK
jgi:hypothetical protein